MSDAMVDQVRRFNRIVTERVGALSDHFLGRERPLGEALDMHCDELAQSLLAL